MPMVEARMSPCLVTWNFIGLNRKNTWKALKTVMAFCSVFFPELTWDPQ